MTKAPMLCDLKDVETRPATRCKVSERNSQKLDILFAPNLSLKISPMSQKYRWQVVFNEFDDGGIVDTRSEAETSIKDCIAELGISSESVNRIASALRLDAQMRSLKGFKLCSSLRVYVG